MSDVAPDREPDRKPSDGATAASEHEESAEISGKGYGLSPTLFERVVASIKSLFGR
jgi:hypothetical protein